MREAERGWRAPNGSRTCGAVMARQVAVAAYAYAPTSKDDLTLQEGDMVEVHPPTPELVARFGPFGSGDGWACGTLLSTGQQGMFPEAYVSMLPPEAAEAPAPAGGAVSAPPPKPKKKRGFKGNAARVAAKMATKAKNVAVGDAGGDSSGAGEGSCGKCLQGCFVYGPQHPEFAAVGHLGDWTCDICGAQFVNSEQTLVGYENLYACRTFESCDWIACGKSEAAVSQSSLLYPGDMSGLIA